MDVEVRVFVKDPHMRLPRRSEPYVIRNERLFLDGPVSDRVAVLDIDSQTGALRPGARFVSGKPEEPKKRKKRGQGEELGRYEVGAFDGKSNDARFLAVAVFGGVMQTIKMFEEPETLGRRVDWAFDGPQLLIVPRAGEAANAFYERDSRSLQFFSFRPDDGDPPIVHTCKSQDIITHETTHALIDAVAPDLYDAVSPQSLAIHEGVADIGALLAAVRNEQLAAAVLEATRGNLRRPNAFPTIAEQFGRELEGRRGGLRNLTNTRTMKDGDLDRTEPHALSTVFSGALYDVFVRIFEATRKARGDMSKALGSDVSTPKKDDGANSRKSKVDHKTPGFALWFAGRVFQRFVLRALDFLPPGEISFADYGRAMYAADRASYPGTSRPRTWLKQAFVARRIVARPAELVTPVPARAPRLVQSQIEDLTSSDFAAYRFAEANRALLGLPRGVPFEVRKRQIVEKVEWHSDGRRPVKQLLFKVSWTEREPAQLGGAFPRWRQLHVGTTLVYDVEQGRVCARLTTGGAGKRRAEHAEREGILRRLRASGALRIGDEIEGVDGRPAPGFVHGHRVGDALKVHGMARMLHIAEVP